MANPVLTRTYRGRLRLGGQGRSPGPRVSETGSRCLTLRALDTRGTPLGLGCVICKMGMIQGDQLTLVSVVEVPRPRNFSPLLPRPGKTGPAGHPNAPPLGCPEE